MIQNVFQIFIVGFGILTIAVIVNFLANFLGLETWYSFIAEIQKNGISDSLKSKWPHLLFLVFVYPFVLGLTGYWLLKLFQ